MIAIRQAPIGTNRALIAHMSDTQKILVVDDNSDCRGLLVLTLTPMGYDVIEAASALEAVERSRTTAPHLIIMDLGLPGIAGDEAIARIKADPSTKHIPILVLTAFPDNKITARALAMGAAEILRKPFNCKILQEKLRRHLLIVSPLVPSSIQKSSGLFVGPAD